MLTVHIAILLHHVRENNMLLEGIQTEKLCKIHLNAGDKYIGCRCCQSS